MLNMLANKYTTDDEPARITADEVKYIANELLKQLDTNQHNEA